MIKDLTREKLEPVLGAKVQGTLNLHEAVKDLPLDFFVFYSSIAALLGTPAQGNYAAANAFMDAFGAYRRGKGLAATSVQWGPWGEIGMAARVNTSETIVLKFDPDAGMDAMRDILKTDASLKSGSIAVMRMKWTAYIAALPTLPAFLEKFKKYRASRVKLSNVSPADVKKIIVDVLQDVLSEPGVNLEGAFMDMGLDSLAAVEFRNRMQSAFGGLRLSPTLMFDYPTVADLSDYVVS